MADVLAFFRQPTASDWTNAELAKLCWVQNVLTQASIPLEADRGRTDEGDPWFVFCRADGAVLLHIARVGGRYHLYSPVLRQPLIGTSFDELARTFVSALPVFVQPNASPGRVVLHPAAMMSLLVATIYFCFDACETSGQAQAADAQGTAAKFGGSAVSPQSGDRQQTSGWMQYERSLDLRDVLSALSASHNAALMAFAMLVDNLVGNESLALSDDHVAKTSAASLSVAATHDGSWDRDERPSFSEEAPWAWAATGHSAVTQALVPARPALPDPSVQLANVGNVSAGLQSPERALLSADSSIAIVASAATAPAGERPTNGLANAQSLANAKASVASAIEGDAVVIQGGASLVIDPASGLKYIHTVGDGVFSIDGLTSGHAPTIVASAGGAQSLVLNYVAPDSAMADGSSYLVAQMVVLKGGVTAEIAPKSSDAKAAGTLDLTLISSGADPNTAYLDEPKQLNYQTIIVAGSQDLVLHEAAKIFMSSLIDATNFDASLTVAVNLGEASNQALSVGSSNFIVKELQNLSLLNIGDGATLDVATSLNTLAATVAADAAVPGALKVALQGSASHITSISTVSAGGIDQLAIVSNGDAVYANHIGALGVPSLSELAISGSGSLIIGSILSVFPENANILIDSTALKGSLTLDITGVGSPDGRSVTLKGGAGNDHIINADPNLAATITGGGGADRFVVAAGQTNVTFTDLDSADKIIVGGGEGSGKSIIVDATDGPVFEQADGGGVSLISAAMAAANHAANEADHQAVLFAFEGGDYVFIDANGDHNFDHGQDALVHLVGGVKLAELDNVFWVN